MKKILLLGICLFVFSFGYMSATQNIMTVSGVADVFFKPDIAYITIGIEDIYKQVNTGQRDINDKINRFVSEIRDIIAKKDIQTAELGIRKHYEYNQSKKRREFAGYKMTQQLMLKTKDFNKIGTLIDKGVRNGLNIIHTLTFDAADKEAYMLQALARATETAKKKADTIAKVLDIHTVKIKNIEEQHISYPQPVKTRLYEAKLASMETSDDSTTIYGKEIKITARVSLTLEFEKN